MNQRSTQNAIAASSLLAQDARHHLHPLTNPVALSKSGPDMVTHAEGVYLYTDEGRQILDIGSGLGNVAIGYGNPRLCEAAYQAMQRLSYGQTLFGRSHPWVAALCAKLAAITPLQFEQFLFASSGSEAVESAIKLALRYWRMRDKPAKRAVISRRLSYHGNTLFAAGLTANWDAFHTQFGLPISSLIYHADSPYGYRDNNGMSSEEFGLQVAQSLERQILEIGPDHIAAFVGDVIQTGGGTIIPPDSYWPAVRRICSEYDILLIADEVISGFGRTGKMFGFENFAFEPDLFVMAKGITSGYFPLSAVAVGAKMAEVIRSADEVLAHVFTNCGHPVGAAVALENIAILEDNGLVERVHSDIGPYFSKRLGELRELSCVSEVRSLGVMGGLEIDLSAGSRLTSKAEGDAFLDQVSQIAWQRGVAMRGSGLCLPLIITHEQIDVAIGVLKESIAEAATRHRRDSSCS